MKTLVADKIDSRHLRTAEGDGVEIVDRAGITAEELARVLPEFKGLIVRSRTKVNAQILEHATNLEVIGRAGTGVDNIDVDAATRRGIVVMNTPGGNSNAAAEMSIALLMATARLVPQAAGSIREGRFEPAKFVGTEVRGKTLGIVGLGRIGQLVAEKAFGLGMQLIGYDPVISAERARTYHVESVDLEAIWRRSDFITIHVPLISSTQHLIDAAVLERMKPGVRIVNCARGGIIDEGALLDALKAGKVAGAALDVFEVEPPPKGGLIDHPGVIATPHLGASTIEAQDAVSRAAVEQVVDFLRGRSVVGAVNALALDPAAAAVVRPWSDLAQRLGRIAAAVAGTIDGVRARYFGTGLLPHSRLLTAHFLRGFLQRFLGNAVNEINARAMAKERGLAIEESTQDDHDSFHGLMIFETTGRTPLALGGALFGKSSPRIVLWNDYVLDAVPEGWLLVVQNHDRPGIVGRVGTALGTSGVNIGSMSLGRTARSGEALSIINLDSQPPAGALAMIRQQEGVMAVHLVHVD